MSTTDKHGRCHPILMGCGCYLWILVATDKIKAKD